MSARLTEAVLRAIDDAVLCWLATVSPDGVPNVSPKEIFRADGDEALLIAHVASPVSVANLRARPDVCVSFIDVFRQEGFKIVGRAALAEPGEPDFAAWSAPLAAFAGPAFPIKAAIRVTPTKIARILPPSRMFMPERSRAEELAATYRRYGVRPKD